jgi:hypothetical protein
MMIGQLTDRRTAFIASGRSSLAVAAILKVLSLWISFNLGLDLGEISRDTPLRMEVMMRESKGAVDFWFRCLEG